MHDFENMDKRYIIFGNIFLLRNRLQTVMDINTKDLTAKQWFVIAMLEMFETPPTLKELSILCNSSHQNTKQIVLKLEKKGFVAVESDTNDKRAIRIRATKKYKDWSEENKEYTTRFIEKMFSSLSKEEISIMCKAQLKLYENLESMEG